jgi:hypothetical protein
MDLIVKEKCIGSEVAHEAEMSISVAPTQCEMSSIDAADNGQGDDGEHPLVRLVYKQQRRARRYDGDNSG